MKIALLLMLACFAGSCSKPSLRLTCSKANLLANGYDVSRVNIYGSTTLPVLSFAGEHTGVKTTAPVWRADHWHSEVQAGILPMRVCLLVQSGKRRVQQVITINLQTTDFASDGTPDFLRLDEESDRQAFRRWFTYSAELQYFLRPEARAPQVTDCSALVRYSYVEGLREHHSNVGPPVRKYRYPNTPLGPAIFRTQPGVYLESDAREGIFREFADAQKLWRDNTFLVSRNLARAQPGDILFYRRRGRHGVTHHSMIFLGQSYLSRDNNVYVVYHTGPDGEKAGELRRLTTADLLAFPDPQWRPLAANPLFLGVYRWNILRAPS